MNVQQRSCFSAVIYQQVYQEINDFKRYIHANKKINTIKYIKIQEDVTLSQCVVTVFPGSQTDSGLPQVCSHLERSVSVRLFPAEVDLPGDGQTHEEPVAKTVVVDELEDIFHC